MRRIRIMKNISDIFLAAIGLVLLSAGFFMLKAMPESQGMIRSLPFICIGLGCGVFGHGVGNFISARTLKKQPDIEKQIEIELKDERNIAISQRAKAKAYDLMIYVFGAVMLSFALMQVPVAAILLLVSAYLFVVFYSIYFRHKYNQEM